MDKLTVLHITQFINITNQVPHQIIGRYMGRLSNKRENTLVKNSLFEVVSGMLKQV